MLGLVQLVPKLLELLHDELTVVGLLKDMMPISETIDRRPKRPCQCAAASDGKDQKAIMKVPSGLSGFYTEFQPKAQEV
jgi:hypothetical protein